MSSVLKGNFTTKKTVETEPTATPAESLESRFEREALKHLGGSIAFVAKKKVLWDLGDPPPADANAAPEKHPKSQP